MRKMRPAEIGYFWDHEQRNVGENVQEYIDTLEWFRPRGFAKLRNEGEKMLRRLAHQANCNDIDDAGEHAYEWMQDCDNLLSDHANKYPGGEYICFGPFEHGGATGYYVNVEGAQEDADLVVGDISKVPANFSGSVVHINDRGNVTLYRYSRGKSRELWAIV